MSLNDLGELLFILAVVILVLVFLAALILHVFSVPLDIRVADQCIQCGYPDHKVLGGIGYCIRLESGTEIVRPVSEACSR